MSLAYFPLYADDFEADTAHLTLAEDGAYNRLLRLCWRTPGCSVPADKEWVYRRLRAITDADREVIDAVLDEFFTVREGRFSNARLSKEWLAANEAHERRKKAGAKGGKAKSLKTNEPASSNAVAKPKQPEPEPEPEEKRVAKATRKKTRTRLPEGWRLPKDYGEWAVSKGLDEATIRRQADKFADHHRAKGSLMLDWKAAWRTWVNNHLEWRGGNGANTPANPGGQKGQWAGAFGFIPEVG